MACDVAPGAPPVVALVQAAKHHARLVQRLDPRRALQFSDAARAQVQQVVKAAFGDDQPSVDVEFAERQRRIDHQPPFGGAIDELHSKQRPLAIAECLDNAVSGLNFQATLANQSPQISPERRAHHPRSILLDCPAVRTAQSSPLNCVRLRKVPSHFQVQIWMAGHSARANPQPDTSCFGPIQGRKARPFHFGPVCARGRTSQGFLIVDYVSTRGAAPILGFADALLAGLARDGGLYLPLTVPHLPPDAIRALRGIPYPEAALRLMAPFVGKDFDHAEMNALTAAAYSGFRHAAIAPLTQVDDNLFTLELFHGPTLAFEDFAMQWLGQAMNCVLRRRSPGDNHWRDLGRHRRCGD